MVSPRRTATLPSDDNEMRYALGRLLAGLRRYSSHECAARRAFNDENLEPRCRCRRLA